MSTEVAKPGQPLTPEEADRLASRIRPSWELDEAEFGPADAKELAAAEKPGAPAISRGGLHAEITKQSANFGVSSEIPRDTVIDGMPTLGVGTTDPGPEQEANRKSKASEAKARAETAPRPAAPIKAQATRVGLGSDDSASELSSSEPTGDGQAIVSSKIVSVGDESSQRVEVRSVPPPTEPSAVDRPADPNDNANTDPDPPPVAPLPRPSKSKSGSLPLPPARASRSRSGSRPTQESPVDAQPIAPEKASFSRADDPIEIPVQKSSRTVIFAMLGAVAVAAAVCGVVVFSSNDDKKPDAPTSKAEPTPNTTPPAPTTHLDPAPVKTAEPAATTPPVETAAPTPVETAATTAPIETSKPEPPKVADTPKPGGTKPGSGSLPPAPSGKKPSKPGGIIRDAPF